MENAEVIPHSRFIQEDAEYNVVTDEVRVQWMWLYGGRVTIAQIISFPVLQHSKAKAYRYCIQKLIDYAKFHRLDLPRGYKLPDFIKWDSRTLFGNKV